MCIATTWYYLNIPAPTWSSHVNAVANTSSPEQLMHCTCDADTPFDGPTSWPVLPPTYMVTGWAQAQDTPKAWFSAALARDLSELYVGLTAVVNAAKRLYTSVVGCTVFFIPTQAARAEPSNSVHYVARFPGMPTALYFLYAKLECSRLNPHVRKFFILAAIHRILFFVATSSKPRALSFAVLGRRQYELLDFYVPTSSGGWEWSITRTRRKCIQSRYWWGLFVY